MIMKKISKLLKSLRRIRYNVSIQDDVAKIYWNGNKIILHGGEDDIDEIFGREIYKKLNVKDKNVIDVGASIGDTPIYFSRMGAKKVYAYEMDNDRFMIQSKNYHENDVHNIISENKKVLSVKDLRIEHPTVLKMDIEGGEFQFFANSEKQEISKFDEIIMEFHGNPKEIVDKISEAGFSVEINHSILGENGILYAKRN